MAVDLNFYFQEDDVLGNLYPCRITIAKTVPDQGGFDSTDKYSSTEENLETYESAEHLYQAFKFASDTDFFQNHYAKLIQEASTPMEARILGEKQNINLLIDDGLTKHEQTFTHSIENSFTNSVENETNEPNGFSQTVSPAKDWNEKREDVMFMCLLAKFIQNPKLAEYLLSTKNSILHLSSQFNKALSPEEKKLILKEKGSEYSYWSTGLNHLGGDRLGAILMQVREELKLYNNIV